MIIKKYKLTSVQPEEVEFEVTITKLTQSTIKTTQLVDDTGNVISSRKPPKIETETDVREGISAISIPSRAPAIVEIIEKDDLFGSVSANSVEETTSDRAKPKNLTSAMTNQLGPNGRAAPIDLDAFMHEDGAKPQTLPVQGDIVWADEE